MTEPTPELQFERAEFEGTASPATACAMCRQPLLDEYHQAGSLVTCEVCRRQIEREWNRNSGFGRFVRAAAFGTVAALVCAGLYAGITMLLKGVQWSFISIGVGYVVGIAVRAGAGRRGGWPYQGLAMFLTYSAIVLAYAAIRWRHSLGENLPANLSGLEIAVVTVLMIVSMYAEPFRDGIGNLLGIIIIGIGVYEAWQLNRKTVLQISGPYKLLAVPAPPAGEPAS